jgi:hypothetical protein
MHEISGVHWTPVLRALLQQVYIRCLLSALEEGKTHIAAELVDLISEPALIVSLKDLSAKIQDETFREAVKGFYIGSKDSASEELDQVEADWYGETRANKLDMGMNDYFAKSLSSLIPQDPTA